MVEFATDPAIIDRRKDEAEGLGYRTSISDEEFEMAQALLMEADFWPPEILDSSHWQGLVRGIFWALILAAAITSAVGALDASPWSAVAVMAVCALIVGAFMPKARENKFHAFMKFADALLDCRTIMTGVDPRRRRNKSR